MVGATELNSFISQMMLFETKRLVVKKVDSEDKNSFFELFSDPLVIDPIPESKYTDNEILKLFRNSKALKRDNVTERECVFGIYIKGISEMIGIALFLINDENEMELGYRFKPTYWGKGYGTEIIKGMLAFYFLELNVEKVVAEVNKENSASMRILNYFMAPVSEYYNVNDNCIDIKFEIKKQDWLKKSDKSSE